MRKRLRRWLLGAWLCFAMLPVVAHEMSMAEMEIRETAAGEFVWQWVVGSDRRPVSEELAPVWPAPCQAQGATLRCGRDGLQGTLQVEGVGDRYSAAIVRVYWLDGGLSAFTLTASQPRAQLFGSAEDRRSWFDIGGAYLHLGIEHILSGYDHLLFVCGLLFLVGFRRQLLLTITAFTVAHSLTLASAALGLFTLRSAPVEATIALSIVLVAAESLHRRETLARRWPALVAFLFGLVHGMGFAGALRDIGLPANHVLIALCTFNVGVECGQLMVVGVAWLLWSALQSWRSVAGLRVAEGLRQPVLYGMGSVAAYWSLTRIAAIVS